MIKPLCQEVFELCIMMNIFVPGNNADFCVTFVTWHNNVLSQNVCVFSTAWLFRDAVSESLWIQ